MAYAVSGGNAFRVALDAEQELRAHQQPLERSLDPPLEATFGQALFVEREQPLQVLVGDRPSIGPPRQRRGDLTRTGSLFVS